MRSSIASLPSVCRLHGIFTLPVVPPDRTFIGSPLRDDRDHTSFEDAVVTPSNARLPAARPNIKWSKISVNGVPTGVSNKRTAYDPAECHEALTATNPSYTHLTVTQRPSWVCPPSSYSEGAVSSLSVAFEDPDGSKLRTMLAERQLYIFGTRVTVKK
jgi:hypothetical protein